MALSFAAFSISASTPARLLGIDDRKRILLLGKSPRSHEQFVSGDPQPPRELPEGDRVSGLSRQLANLEGRGALGKLVL